MTENSEAKTKSKKTPFLGKFIKWLIILVFVAGLFGYVGFKYSLVSVNEIKNWLAGIKVAESENKGIQKTEYNKLSSNPPTPVSDDFTITPHDNSANITPPPPPPPVVEEIPETHAQPNFGISVGVGDPFEIQTLRENQKYFVMYIAARDLRDARNNPEKFTSEFKYFMDLTAGNTEIAGKVDILRLTAETGVPTAQKLKDDFGKFADELDKNAERSLWESLKYSASNLVRVTKVKGEENSASPRSVKMRVNKLLDSGDINGAILEAQKLGEQTDDWVKEANNLIRVYEITDYLVEYSRNKIKLQ